VYPDIFSAAITTGSPTVDTTNRPGFRVYTFTSAGSLLIPG
jgi:hypothetical protein